MRNSRIYLNEGWKYASEYKSEMIERSYDTGKMEAVRLPHTNKVLPFNGADESEYQFVSCYRKTIFGEEAYQGKNILLTFEGVAHIAKVYVNGELICTHKGGYTPFTADLTESLIMGQENEIAVVVDSRETNNIPPFGKVVDYMTYGGIYRDVYMEVVNPLHVTDVYVKTSRVLDSEKVLDIEFSVDGVCGNSIAMFEILDQDRNVIASDRMQLVRENEAKRFTLKDVKLWDTENPNLYYCKISLFQSTELVDEYEERFGFRECKFTDNGFFLNGKKVKLLGVNRHQSYPYVGYAMPKSMQQYDVKILKEELGVNAVRTSHYPQSRHFMNACDEMGLLVFTELPGWQHIGDEEWKACAIDQLTEMVLNYRNHPSIILWGARINESIDDDAFYEKTNAVVHKLDPTRQTGGVRYLQKSHLLEDVYTYNDFIHRGNNQGVDKIETVTGLKEVPYLVSEFNGHMFPTKSYDCEEHRTEHALRHVRVINDIFHYNKMSGGFAWCMFDYNTHKDFGSGDRICYHGIMDMFRNPKLAASVYASQQEEKVVCTLNSSMDIGEHPASYRGNIYAFTNADSIKLYKNDEFVREFYPSREVFDAIPHPPIIIDDFIGCLLEEKEGYDHKTSEGIKSVMYAIERYGQNNLPLKFKLKMLSIMLRKKLTFEDGFEIYRKYVGDWGGEVATYRFDVIKDEKVVESIKKYPMKKSYLETVVSSHILKEENSYDVAEIRIRVVDDNGNPVTYCQDALSLSVSEGLEIIGPKAVPLQGGMCGTYVKTVGKKGKATLTITSSFMEEKVIEFDVM
ncbi:beta-galactosidase [Lachnospiraceae bacterium KM106-2]|nr:beta-galactosidase [Lachnospiraceae bacterium KM106-2]